MSANATFMQTKEASYFDLLLATLFFRPAVATVALSLSALVALATLGDLLWTKCVSYESHRRGPVALPLLPGPLLGYFVLFIVFRNDVV